MKNNFVVNNFERKYNMPDPACVYKWGWSTIFLQSGTTSSCHRTDPDFITVENFKDFHNTPSKLKARQDMLNGVWPGHGCEYCMRIEDAGGISDRTEVSDQLSENLVPIELIKSPRSLQVSPTMVEVYFSNLCNMSCIYCGPKWSTVWENEARKFNLYPKDVLDIWVGDPDYYQNILPKFWEWLEHNVDTISKYNILGGEPFYQPELETNINFFETHPCPNLELTIFSNLKVNKEKFKKILKQLDDLLVKNHLKSVCITCSFDCWGPQQEYIRTGINLENWEENFEILTSEFPKINVRVHGTMISLTIKTIPELVKKINHVNRFRNENNFIPLGYNMVFDPACMNPDIFPKGFFDKDFDAIDDVIVNEYDKNIMRGYQQSINSGDYRPDMIKKLKSELDALDSRRGTNWKLLFPWLEQFQV